MKKKYEKILIESSLLVGKIPGVNMTGATATASAYISAYSDYHEACGYLGTIANNIHLMDNLERTINKYKGKEDYDIEELEGQVKWYGEQIDIFYVKLKEFVMEREQQLWQ